MTHTYSKHSEIPPGYCSNPIQNTPAHGMVAVHFTTKLCEPNTASRHIESHIFFTIFVPVITTLCMLGLKLFELFCEFLRAF